MSFIVTLSLCVAAGWAPTALGPASLAPRPSLQEPEEGGGPPSAPFEAPPLCPEPLISEPRRSPLELTSEGRVVFTTPALEPLAQVLSEDFAAVTGLKLAVAGIPARSGDIVLSRGYMPDTVRENPEAFFIEVFDHVLIAGQSLDGAARATARFLQLVQPTETSPSAGNAEGDDPSARPAAGLRVTVPPVRIVDAPSIRWRVLEIASDQLSENTPRMRCDNARSLIALAHLSGHTAVSFHDFSETGYQLGTEYDVEALVEEARKRRVELINVGSAEQPAPLRVLDTRYDLVPEAEKGPTYWARVAAELENANATLMCPRDPFPSGAMARALGPDEATTARRLPRLLHPIPPVGRAAGASPLLGELYGHRIALGSDTFVPVGWRATLSNRWNVTASVRSRTAALAGEAWHGGMRVDALRGAPELERVLAAVDAALKRAK